MTTLPPELEEQLDQRIHRLARGRRHADARRELKEHILNAAQDLAGDHPITRSELDQAFNNLGSPEDVRATFFAPRPKAAITPPILTLFAASVLITAVAALADHGGAATCEVEGPGDCTATSAGAVPDALLLVAAPLTGLAALLLAPTWVAATLTAGYLAFAVARLTASLGADAGSLSDAAILVAALCATAAILLQLRNDRGARHD